MDEQLSAQEMPYTNREIREKWHDLQNTLSAILVQTSATNGRVGKLELTKAENGGFYKAMAIAGAIGWTITFSLVTWILLQLVGLDNKINTATHQAVDDALKAYQIEP